MLQSLSRAQIERLLQAKERIETLQSRRDDLRKELAQIEATLGGLLEGSGDVAKTARGSRKAKVSATTKAATKKAAAKKVTKKATKKATKKTAKKAAKKPIAKKPAIKVAKAAKPNRGKAAAAAKDQRGGGEKRATLEDVIYSLIEKRGKPVPFQDLLGTITGKKLFKTRSTNFDNVLRRTLSTSTRIKRVGRGMYGI
jgi:ElaB/YqjD/DUF883 family membrane-anchored ribosome-binding protein